jgi:hypothetical protein
MSPQQIVEEMKDLRRTLERSTLRLYELAKALYQHARRSPADDSTAIYITYANAWSRFSGAMTHGLARTASSDRILGALPTVQSEPKPPKLRPQEAPQKQEAFPSTPSVEDLMQMYTEEGSDAR